MIYGFNSEDVAFALKGIGEERLTGLGSDPAPTGKEVIFVKTPEGGIPARPPQPDPDDPDAEDPEAMEAVECKRVYIDEDLMLQESEDQVLDVANTSTTEIPGNTYIKVAMLGVNWVAVPDGSPTVRVKFRIADDGQEQFMNSVGSKGQMNAEVLDPLNSGLTVGDTFVVHDPYQEFMFTTIGSAGLAVRANITAPDPDTNEDTEQVAWVIEQCDQAVVRVKGTINQPLVPWASDGNSEASIPEVTNITSESYWPYIIWLSGEDSSITSNVSNPHRYTANPGDVWLERREISANATTSVSPMTYPETGEEPTWQWVVVDVEKPTARYLEVMAGNNGEWLMNGGEFWEGSDPEDNGEIQGVTVPSAIADDPTWCAVPAGTPGVAFLDDNTGYYIVTSTMSAMYGSGTLSEVIGQEMSDSPGSATPMLYDDADDCNKLRYKRWKNVVVFGNTEGGDCFLHHEDPDPSVELGGQYEKDVVTGIQVNAQGDLEFTTTTVKVCEPDDGVKPAPNTNITYLTDVGCEGNEFTQQYKSYNILGAPVTEGSQAVDASCIANDFDWEYIFNNYVYNEDWWTVNYYDITYPEGCEPCGEPTGCCTAAAYPDGQSGITQAECEAETGYESWTEGECGTAPPDPTGCCTITGDQGGTLTYDSTMLQSECTALEGTSVMFDGGPETVTSTSFVEGSGPCESDCSDDCCCGIVSDVFIQVNCPPDPMQPGGSGSPVWMFEQSGSATGDGSCVWSVDGIWRDDDGNETNGTVTVTASGGDFTMAGQNPDGDSLTGTQNGQVTTTACSSIGQWYFNHDNEPACQ